MLFSYFFYISRVYGKSNSLPEDIYGIIEIGFGELTRRQALVTHAGSNMSRRPFSNPGSAVSKGPRSEGHT